jgi:hypothetical protein
VNVEIPVRLGLTSMIVPVPVTQSAFMRRQSFGVMNRLGGARVNMLPQRGVADRADSRVEARPVDLRGGEEAVRAGR